VAILVESEGVDKRRKKIKRIRKDKGKRKKRVKNEEVNGHGQGGKAGRGKGVSWPHAGLIIKVI